MPNINFYKVKLSIVNLMFGLGMAFFRLMFDIIIKGCHALTGFLFFKSDLSFDHKIMFSLSTTYQQAKENLDTLLTQIETENTIGIITRPGHKDIALLPAEELTSLLETVYLLRSPANAKRLFSALQRSLERDINPPPNETIEKLCQELEIEREK